MAYVAIIDSTEILLVNPAVHANQVQELTEAYRSKAPPPPLVVATYKGRHLALNGCHRLAALAEVVKSGDLPASEVWSKYVLTIDGDKLAEHDDARISLDWLEAHCLNPPAPDRPVTLDAVSDGEKLMRACAKLRDLSPSSAVKESLKSDAGSCW